MRNVFVVIACLVGSIAIAIQGANFIQAGADAPVVKGNLSNGKAFDSSSASKSKPTFVIFWKQMCPHNPGASAAFNAIAKHYGDKATIVGVVSANDEGAKEWAKQYQTAYPMLGDPEKSIIKSYGLKKSIISYQINGDGKVEAVFPGYGRSEMNDLNKAMAAATKMEPADLTNVKMPERLTWG